HGARQQLGGVEREARAIRRSLRAPSSLRLRTTELLERLDGMLEQGSPELLCRNDSALDEELAERAPFLPALENQLGQFVGSHASGLCQQLGETRREPARRRPTHTSALDEDGAMNVTIVAKNVELSRIVDRESIDECAKLHGRPKRDSSTGLARDRRCH